MKILLVDNNQGITGPLSKLLKTKGFETAVSNSGRNGLSLIESNHFDAILLDISMPGYSGFDVIDALYRSGKIKENKIIVMSGNNLSTEQLNNLKAKGIHSCLKKPVEIDTIFSTLRVVCEI